MNSLLKLLDISFPIIQAPMAGVSTPAMAAAVSNAGGLGSIAVGAVDANTAHKTIRSAQSLTERPINVNVFCHQPAATDKDKEARWISRLAPFISKYNGEVPEHLNEIYKSFLVDDHMLEVLLECKPRIISFHFGLPSKEKIMRLKNAGVVLLASATNLEEAEQVQNSGVDVVVAQGFEAGGHRGVFDPARHDPCLSTSALVQLLSRKIRIPIVAAGGIMDGASIAAALCLGAQTVQLGTAFIGCPESAADEHFRKALQSDAAYNTVMTKVISGRPARCLANLFTTLGQEIDQSIIPDYPIAYDAGKLLNAAAKATGEGGYGAQWAGQGAPLVRNLPAGELVKQLHREMLACIDVKRV